MFRKLIPVSVLFSAVFIFGVFPVHGQSKKEVLLGYFEGGKHPVHDLLRREFEQQLQAVLGDSITPIFIPQGFRSAAWNRDSSHIYAKQLVGIDRIDIMITMGPWATEDLLAAGYKKPIISMYRFDPASEDMLNQVGLPKAKNVTVTGLNGNIERDIVTLVRLVRPKKIAALFFHDSGSGEETIGEIQRACEKFKIDLQIEESYNNFGTFAFFAALKKLGRKVDALYLGPLWGMDAVKIDEFLRNLKELHIPVLSADGSYATERGALASAAGYTYLTEARVAALKLLDILHGTHPNELPVFVDAPTGLAINLQTATEIGINLPYEAVNEALLFGNDIPATADSYTLNQATYRSISTHPTAQAADEEVTAAAQTSRNGADIFDPQLSLQIDAMRHSDEYVNNSHWLKNSGVHGELGFEATILSLENLRAHRMGKQEKNVAEAERASALGDLETAVALAYAANIEADYLVKTYQESRLAIERNLELEKMTRSYEQTTDDSKQVHWETERLEVMTKLTSAYHERKRARVLLSSLLNMPVGTPINTDSVQFSEGELYDNYLQFRARIMTPAEEAKLRGFLLQQAQKTNPEFRVTQSSAEVFAETASSLSGRRWPTFGLFAKGLYTDEQANIPGEFTEDDFSWTLGGRIRWSLWEPFTNRQERKRMRAEQHVQEYRRDSLSLALMNDIENGVSNLVEQMNNVPTSIKWRKSALLQYQNLAQKYEAGTVSVNELVAAHDDAERASIQAITERFDFYRRLAELTNRLGWSAANSQGTYVTEFFRRIGAGLPAPLPDTP